MADLTEPAEMDTPELFTLRDRLEAELRARLSAVASEVRKGSGWHSGADHVLERLERRENGEIVLRWHFDNDLETVVEEQRVREEEMEDLDAVFLRFRRAHLACCSMCGARDWSENAGSTCSNADGTLQTEPISEFDGPREIRLVAAWVREQEDEHVKRAYDAYLPLLTLEQLASLPIEELTRLLQSESREVRTNAQLALSQAELSPTRGKEAPAAARRGRTSG